MKITLQLGKAHFKFVDAGFDEFTKRLKHYCKFESALFELPTKLKTTDIVQIKKNEGELLLKKIQPTDFVILLDENGKEYNSVGLCRISTKTAAASSYGFIIGGAFGFSPKFVCSSQCKSIVI